MNPKIVCLCGSTKFKDYFVENNLAETLAGNIVLTIGCDMKSDQEIFGQYSPDEMRDVKERLDILHYCKIDLADEVLVLNVGGYIGDSTRREILYAKAKGKNIRYLEAIGSIADNALL